MDADQLETYLKLYREFIRPTIPNPKKLEKAVRKERTRVAQNPRGKLTFRFVQPGVFKPSPDSLERMYDSL